MAKYTITADSKPDFDDWGPDDYWSLKDWVDWHKALVNKYSDKTQKITKMGVTVYVNPIADGIWIGEWKKQSSFAPAVNSLLNVSSDEFKYIKEWLLLYFNTGAFINDTSPYNPSAIMENVVKPVGETIYTSLKFAKIGLIVGVVGAFIFLGLYAYNTLKSAKKINYGT